MKIVLISVVVLIAASLSEACTITTVTGTHAPAPGSFCAGQLIFEDNFDSLDHGKWRHEVTLGGGGNNEVNFLETFLFCGHVKFNFLLNSSNGTLMIVLTHTSSAVKFTLSQPSHLTFSEKISCATVTLILEQSAHAKSLVDV